MRKTTFGQGKSEAGIRSLVSAAPFCLPFCLNPLPSSQLPQESLGLPQILGSAERVKEIEDDQKFSPLNASRMKLLSTLFLGVLFVGTSYVTGTGHRLLQLVQPQETEAPPPHPFVYAPPSGTSATAVSDVVAKALAFKASLTTAQQATLEQTFTASLARKWSNLPCGSTCRNGIQLGTLNSTQLGLALEVIKAAAGTTANEGSDEFYQIRLADKVLNQQYGASGYDSTIYFLSFLNTPTTTGAWMLQYGGHHYAANIAFNGGQVVGPTPMFEALEPTSFTVNGTTYTPLAQEVTALRNMLASLTTAQLTTARNSSTFNDLVMSPGETNGGNGTFPATKAGIAVSTLNSTQQALVLAAIEPYLQDVDEASAAILRTQYAKGINGTYVTWTGSGTSGNASSFLNANTNYVRIDGPDVWIEFVCQNGVVIPAQIHYHSIWRDHVRDYGANLTLTALPVSLAGFGAKLVGGKRLLTWNTTEESTIHHYEVERSTDGLSYTPVTKVAARSGTANSYSFTDEESLAANLFYYRLKIVEANGSFRYSQVVTLKNSRQQSGLTVYPNPVGNKLTVWFAEAVTQARLTVMNLNGTVVLAKAVGNGNEFGVDVSHLAAGHYVLQAEAGGRKQTVNFVKE